MHFEEKPPNHERWIISYADFTTLLLATFVVMYAVSSINSSKFQEMAEAFSTAFIGRTVTLDSTGLGAPNKAPFDFMPSPVHVPVVTRQEEIKNLPIALRQENALRAMPQGETDKTAPVLKQGDFKLPPIDIRRLTEHHARELDAAYEKLTQALSSLIGKGEVQVSLQSLGVVIDINDVLLFSSGKAQLTSDALPLIDQVAGILKGLPYQIQVNGFTDNAPIHNPQFDSNWDLSATRAISVVKRFVSAGVDPGLIVGAGFGEYHPVVSNSTPEGKAQNRRVSIVVVSPAEDESAMKVRLFGGDAKHVSTSPMPSVGAVKRGDAPLGAAR
ncbi:MAG: OmpA family protein [Alphaproteobacteria bacterium]|nr:OmpA family protein [Alphaproteobacteria bacterium]